MRSKVKKLKISAQSSLVIKSDCTLDDVEIDGHAEIDKNGGVSLKHFAKNYKKLVPTEGNE